MSSHNNDVHAAQFGLHKFVKKYTSTQEIVLVAVSGGADSVALLRSLLAQKADVIVAHFNHCFREESKEDLIWVEQLANFWNVPFVSGVANVPLIARKRGWNLEEAGRRLRYDFLARTAKRHGASVILTAHTRRDVAETVLLRAIRGEAPTGILQRWGRVERPFLQVSRAEIEAYLRAIGQPWREDSSNLDGRFARAWLRAEVMPTLEKRFPSAEKSLARLAELTAEDDDFLQDLADRWQRHQRLGEAEAPLRRRAVLKALKNEKLRPSALHLSQIAQKLQDGGGAVAVSGELVHVSAGKLVLPSERPHFAAPDFQFPADWTLRNPVKGDRMRLGGGRRHLSDLLSEAKVPRPWRGEVLILANGDGVQWVGLRPALWAVGAEAQTNATDATFLAMSAAIELAKASGEESEVPIGAVVLDEGENIIGRGRNRCRARGDMTRHAETEALREAAKSRPGGYLSGCTLVVTLEPCPMCLGAALEARVSRVVYGARNPKAGALGGVHDLLRHHWGHAPQVEGGYRARECAHLLKAAFAEMRRRNELL